MSVKSGQGQYLTNVFIENDIQLREYFNKNRNRSNETKRRLFYVIQAGRLQCLNGAYLSEVDAELAKIILGDAFDRPVSVENTVREVTTYEAIRRLSTRIGQQEFSAKVRDNYNHKCCFPSCDISENGFLVGAHIARWADAPELRGQVSNGLCLCLMHDKAFEAGYFTISEDYRIIVDTDKAINSKWARENLFPFEGKKIKLGEILPSEEALLHHWIRTNFY